MNIFLKHSALESVLQGCCISSKKKVFELIAGLLTTDNNSSDEVYKLLFKRESLGSTFLGNGLVVPHCHSKLVSKTKIAVIYLKNNIEYNEQKADVFIGIIFPDHGESNEEHLSVLSDLMTLVKDENLLEKIRITQTNQELNEMLIKIGND